MRVVEVLLASFAAVSASWASWQWYGYLSSSAYVPALAGGLAVSCWLFAGDRSARMVRTNQRVRKPRFCSPVLGLCNVDDGGCVSDSGGARCLEHRLVGRSAALRRGGGGRPGRLPPPASGLAANGLVRRRSGGSGSVDALGNPLPVSSELDQSQTTKGEMRRQAVAAHDPCRI